MPQRGSMDWIMLKGSILASLTQMTILTRLCLKNYINVRCLEVMRLPTVGITNYMKMMVLQEK